MQTNNLIRRLPVLLDQNNDNKKKKKKKKKKKNNNNNNNGNSSMFGPLLNIGFIELRVLKFKVVLC